MPASHDVTRDGRVRATSSVQLAGLPIAAVRRAHLVEAVFDGLARGEGGWIVTANVDFLRLAAQRPEVHALFREADWILADGMPLLWAARAGGQPLPERIAGSDLVVDLAARAAQTGRRLFLLGGEADTAEEAAARLRAAYPRLEIAGTASPRLSDVPAAEELHEARRLVEAARPDLVYAAFGAPKQEYVIRALRPSAPRAWWIGCGISLAFLAGHVKRAPGWMQRTGLEWVHRMAQEPGRLWRRYLLHDVGFALRLLIAARRDRDAGHAARNAASRS